MLRNKITPAENPLPAFFLQKSIHSQKIKHIKYMQKNKTGGF